MYVCVHVYASLSSSTKEWSWVRIWGKGGRILKIILTFLFCFHCIQNGLSLPLVLFSQSVDFFFHLGVEGVYPSKKFIERQVSQLQRRRKRYEQTKSEDAITTERRKCVCESKREIIESSVTVLISYFISDTFRMYPLQKSGYITISLLIHLTQYKSLRKDHLQSRNRLVQTFSEVETVTRSTFVELLVNWNYPKVSFH